MGTLYFLLNFAINLKSTLLFFKIACVSELLESDR